MKTPSPDRSTVLTVSDVPELPSGKATVFRLREKSSGENTVLAHIDATGYLRTFEGKYLNWDRWRVDEVMG